MTDSSPTDTDAAEGQCALRDLAAEVENHHRVWLKLAARPEAERYRVIRLEVTAGRRPPGFSKREWAYGRLLLLEVATSGLKAARLIAGSPTVLGDRPFELQVSDSGSYRRWPSKASPDLPALPWPLRHVTFDHSEGSRCTPSGLLVGNPAPSFLSEDDALDVFFHGEKTSRPARHAHRLVARFPETRAYIDHVLFKSTSVAVTVSGDDVAGCRLELGGVDEWESRVLPTRGLTVFAVPRQLPQEWWVVLARDGQWLDYRYYGPFGRSPDLQHAYGPEDLERLVAGGEGVRIEFKSRLPQPSERDTMLKTVAAFANTEGGTILFGVDDNAQIVGVAEPFEVVRDQLVNVVNDGVSPRPKVEVFSMQHTAGTVIGLEVPEGDPKGYSLGHPPVFYIRRGASTVPARRDDVERLLSRQSHGDTRFR